ncbi:MAG: hypothetical protein IT276_14810 [Ignavibacteriaceae bacterium]|nr:hypothetical protein [Ignavibacteriaceae bacterium]
MRLTINNTDYTQDTSGLQELVIAIERDDTGLGEVAFSKSIKANGMLHELIEKTFFINSCEGKKNKLLGKIYVDCGFDFDFELSPDTVSYCADGCSEITIKVKTQRTDKIDCLKNQVSFWSDSGFEDYLTKQGRLYKIMYCFDSGIYMRILIALFSVISIIFDILQGICKIIEIFGDVGFCKKLDNFEAWVLGCDKYHNAILLRDAFEYNAKLCGLEFDSDVFQRDEIYKNTAIESAISNEGRHLADCFLFDKNLNKENQEVKNILQLSTRLIPLINGYVRITDDKFILDHISRRDAELKILMSIEEEYKSGDIEECPIYSFDTEKLCAYLKIEYTQDATDWQGNKMINEYNEIIEWNKDNTNPNNKGECRVNVEFSPLRFTNDSEIKKSSWALELADIRERGGLGLITTDCSYKHAQIISNGQFETSKLIIIDDKEEIKCRSCTYKTSIKKRIGAVQGLTTIQDLYDYNRPLKGSELYNRFYKYNDPNDEHLRIMKIDSVEWKPKDFCKAITEVYKEGLNIGIKTIYGNAIVNSIDVDFDKCTITFKEIQAKCLKR